LGVDVMNRLRIGFALTTILGAIWASAGLFDSLGQVALGLVVCSVGVLGSGAVEWVASR